MSSHNRSPLTFSLSAAGALALETDAYALRDAVGSALGAPQRLAVDESWRANLEESMVLALWQANFVRWLRRKIGLSTHIRTARSHIVRSQRRSSSALIAGRLSVWTGSQQSCKTCSRLVRIGDAENTLARRSKAICRTQTISAMVEVLEDAIWEYRRGAAVACGSSPMA